MFSLTRYTTPCPETINGQILQLVVDNLTDISSVALPPSNLLYNIYQYAIGFEVHLYLEALKGDKGIAVELIVATDAQDAERVLGFLLCLPVKDDPQACGIAFMAVQAGCRRQGVARGMMQDVLARYPHAELALCGGKGRGLRSHGFSSTRCARHPSADEHPRLRHRWLDGRAGCRADLQLAGGAPDPHLPAAETRQARHGGR